MAEPTVDPKLPRAFRPSTFASRRAERERRETVGELPATGRSTLISMGWRSETFAGLGRDARPTSAEYELLLDQSGRAFARWTEGGPVQALGAQNNEPTTRTIDRLEVPRRVPNRGSGRRSDETIWRSTDGDG